MVAGSTPVGLDEQDKAFPRGKALFCRVKPSSLPSSPPGTAWPNADTFTPFRPVLWHDSGMRAATSSQMPVARGLSPEDGWFVPPSFGSPSNAADSSPRATCEFRSSVNVIGERWASARACLGCTPARARLVMRMYASRRESPTRGQHRRGRGCLRPIGRHAERQLAASARAC